MRDRESDAVGGRIDQCDHSGRRYGHWLRGRNEDVYGTRRGTAESSVEYELVCRRCGRFSGRLPYEVARRWKLRDACTLPHTHLADDGTLVQGAEERVFMLIRRSGLKDYHLICRCRALSRQLPHRTARAWGIDQRPVHLLKDNRSIYTCVVDGCFDVHVEWHHFAPGSVFGSDSGRWPQELLCVTHHRAWHERMVGYV